MLKFMREKFQYSLPLKVILIAVAASFVGWGIGTSGRGSKQTDVIAEVMNQKITIQEFQRYYNSLVENYRKQLGDRFSPELLERLNVKSSAFNSLTQRKLLLAMALEKGMTVSDQELIVAIRKQPYFQRDGVFNQRLYENVLRQNRFEPQQFEEYFREDMLIEKLHSIIADSVKVSDIEVRKAYTRENEKVSVDYLSLDAFKYRDKIKPTDEELQKYFQESEESFKKPESLKLKYVKLSPQDYMNQVDVTEEEARSYYEDYPDQFKRGEEVHVRHILLKVEEGADESEWEKVRVEAEKLLKKIKGGADFAELAKKFSQDPGSKDKGGDLGSFPKGQMVKPFEEAAFSLKPGQVSDPVRTRFGYHIIKLEEKQEAGQEPFEDARKKIVEKLKKSKAQDIADDRAYNLSYDLSAEEFDKIAKEGGFKPQATDWVFKGGPIRDVPGSMQIMDDIFNLDVGDISKAMEAGGNYYIFTVLEKREPYIPELKEVEREVKSRYLNKRSREAVEEAAQEALSKLNSGKKLEEIIKEYSLSLQKTDFFTRNGSPKGVGRNPQFINEAFELKPGEYKMVNAGNRFFIISLSGTQGIKEAKFQKEREKFAQELLEKKRDLMYRTWTTRNMDRANIKIVGDFNL